MTLSAAPTIRSSFYKAYSSFVARSCCSRRALLDVSKRYQSTISELNPPPKPQVLPGQRDSLLVLLRPYFAKKHSLDQREDTFVSITELLNHPEFRHLDMGALQELADRDKKHNFIFQYDVDPGKDHWWVRAKRWNEPHLVPKPITSRHQFPVNVIFTTTLREWNSHISRIGIPKPRDEDIMLECKITGPTLDVQDRTTVYISLDLKKAISSGLKFHARKAVPDASPPSHIYTSGDEYGFIPPEYFAKVEIMEAKQTLLWGNPKPLEAPFALKSGDGFIKEGEKLSYMREVDHTYQNLAGAPVKAQVHGKTMDEARLAVI
ncbi:hypothetical protein D9619_006503 [Psilocybe cf. subviscida]|uniref:Uncharacterized protein n=1 Tax=Psilocybe cf. subviscida TaxID=2480587 RepID=A0A8H5EYA1_9AGAR|nr:hypothetical protein D9619_006503 [Psilocybe cf. subviscida]